MTITDLAHTAFGCHDVDTSLAFYSKLGIHESFRLVHDDGRVRLVYLHISGDRFLELFPGGPQPGSEQNTSFRHICLLTDDIETLVSELKSAGITIDREVSQGLDANLQAWVSDPDGNAIEFMQISTESPQHATASGLSITASDILKPAR
jgi:lactoylglutathione lyase